MMDKILSVLNKKKILLILSLCLFIFLIQVIFTTRYREPIYHPIPEYPLKKISGESVIITEEFPTQNYLILFFIDQSPTSIKQIIDLESIINEIPDNISIILIHCGRLIKNLKQYKNERFEVLVDYNAEFTKLMGVNIIPTMFLLSNNQYEIFMSEKFISKEKLRKYLRLLAKK